MGRWHPRVTPPIRLWHFQAWPLQVRVSPWYHPALMPLTASRHPTATLQVFFNIHAFSGLEGDLRWRWMWKIFRRCWSLSLQSNCWMKTWMEKYLIKVNTISLIFLKNLHLHLVCKHYHTLAFAFDLHPLQCKWTWHVSKREALKLLTRNFWQESADKTAALMTANCLESTKYCWHSQK